MGKQLILKVKKWNNKSVVPIEEIVCILREDFADCRISEYKEKKELLKLFYKCVKISNSKRDEKEEYFVEPLDTYELISKEYNAILSTGEEIKYMSLEEFINHYVTTRFNIFNKNSNIKNILENIIKEFERPSIKR